jgi:hypothetical protein
MRILKTTLPIFCPVLFSCLIFFSCEKKTIPDPAPEIDTVLTEDKLTAKWEVVAYRYYRYRNDTLTNKYEFIKDYGGIQNGIPSGSYPWIASECTTYITFKSDHSFFYTDMNGTPEGYMLLDILPNENTSWVFKNSKKIELTTYSTNGSEQADWQVLAYSAPRLLLMTIDTTSMTDNEIIEDATYIELEKQ